MRPLEYPWFHWFELLARTALEEGCALAPPKDKKAQDLIWSFVFNHAQGIGSLIALRSHRLLMDFEVEPGPVRPPQRGTPLFELHEDLLSRPEELFRRVPY